MIIQLLSLLRIRQWYKNSLVFLPLFFSGMLLEYSIYPYILGFFILGLTSSSYYIINDIVDKKNDKVHPEKKHRPIASGHISIPLASTILVLLLAISFSLSILLGPGFFLFNMLLFSSTIIYIFLIKQVAFLDILLLSINFVIRAVSGAFIGSKYLEPSIELSS